MVKILSRISQSSRSIVGTVINEETNQIWAAKKIRRESKNIRQQLIAEKEVLKSLSHPCLPTVIDISDNDESYILVIMEYVGGTTLNKVVEEHGAQVQDKVVEWAKQLCSVLVYLHSVNLIYGNMNPSNIMLKPDGSIKLLDFGTSKKIKDIALAKIACPEEIIYAAPEQLEGIGQTDGRTDIYCLGATLYYLLTGRSPDKAPHEMKPVREINPALSRGLEKIIIKSTQRDPADRYQSVQQMLRALKRCTKPHNMPRTVEFFRRERRAVSDKGEKASGTPYTQIPTMPPSGAAAYSMPPVSAPRWSDVDSGVYEMHCQIPDLPVSAYSDASEPYGENGNVNISQVCFSAVVPKRFIKGDYSMIEIAVYEELYRSVVDRIIAGADTEVKEVIGSVQDISRNTMIRIELSSSDIELSDCEETQRWSGKYLVFDFPVEIPNDYAKKQIRFTATVYFNDIIATRLKFIASCTSVREQKLELIREDVLTAFISYASQDRAEVATIIQGMKKIRPDLDVFFDVDNLRSGEYWEAALKREIEKRDILFLCWSKFAKESEWVEKEWKYALQNKGLDSIEPVSLVSPSECPPPEELKSKHFNDKALLYKKI